jgi:short-subunit dehydrogenase
MPARIEQSTVLLTGATGGIGRAIARSLNARGADLVLTGRRRGVLEELRTELGERARVVPADLAGPEAAAGLAEHAGQIDVLVANAGLPGTGRLEDFTPEQMDRTLDVNLRAPMQLTRALLPGMLERGNGHVVLISSLVGKVPAPWSSVYCATKFGLRGFGFALREELRGTGVGVTTVFPGFIRDAGLFADSGAKLPPGLGTSSPQEVADAVIRGIEKDKGEIDVAPFIVRSGARIFTAAPTVGAAISRAFGGGRIAASVAAGQREKR